MTTHYVDVVVAVDAEIPVHCVMGAVYGRLHAAIARTGTTAVGVSFPGYSRALRSVGRVLRLHGSEAELKALLASPWLGATLDNVRVGDVSPVPPEARHVVFRRRQFKTGRERLVRRRMKRHHESAEAAAAAIGRAAVPRPSLPYVNLRSHSTGQRFALFVEMGGVIDTATPGPFNGYGLGRVATVPWF